MHIRRKIKLTLNYIGKQIWDLWLGLYEYYINPYPILLICGTYKRVKSRLSIVWLGKGKGRPAVSEELVDLIIDMKRSNWIWGALRISRRTSIAGNISS